MSARILVANSLSRRFLLLFEGRHAITQRFVSHERFKEIPWTPFAPKFKPKLQINPTTIDEVEKSVIYSDGSGKHSTVFIVITILFLILEYRQYKDDKTRINRQKIKYKRLGLDPYPYRQKSNA